jgi:import inner membrane translocase subunit TIM17
MGRHANEREPCPWRLIDDLGGGFAFGGALGSIWYFAGGVRNAPKGHRIHGGVARLAARTPVMATGFAMWAMTYSAYECSFSSIRHKEDMWNPILSGACTGATLAFRAGPRVAAQQFLFGGMILGAIEGIGVYCNRVLMPWYEETYLKTPGKIDLLDPPVDVLFKHRGKSLDNGESKSVTGFNMDDYYKHENK